MSDETSDTNQSLKDKNKQGGKNDEARKEAEENEKAWKGAGENVGTQIWRINQFQVVVVAVEDHGKFYDGDSYIILNTYKEDESEELEYNLHFWIGKHSTQDEYGTAAYKTVELDNYLDDKPVQFREVMESESIEFKQLFDSLEYLKGGYSSGFKQRIYKMKESDKKSFCKEFDFEWEKVYSETVFAAYTTTGPCIYFGHESNQLKRYHQNQEFAKKLKKENKKCEIKTQDEGEFIDMIIEHFAEDEDPNKYGNDKDSAEEKVENRKKKIHCQLWCKKERKCEEIQDDVEPFVFRCTTDKWEMVAEGADVENTNNLEDNALYMVCKGGVATLRDKRSLKNPAAMILGQKQVSSVYTSKKGGRRPISFVKNDEKFFKACQASRKTR